MSESFFTIKSLRDIPYMADAAAAWFSEKWGIPYGTYLESISLSIANPERIPQWYLAIREGSIIGGAGIIENDFHKRPDLTPNLCALFVEEPFRRRGIARAILDNARYEAGVMGFSTLYLVTDHTEFYEKCGWTFFTTVIGDDGLSTRMYSAPTSFA